MVNTPLIKEPSPADSVPVHACHINQLVVQLFYEIAGGASYAAAVF